jgi:hypothetical protein
VRVCKDLRRTAVRAKAVSSLGDGKRSKCFKFRFEEKIKNNYYRGHVVWNAIFKTKNCCTPR